MAIHHPEQLVATLHRPQLLEVHNCPKCDHSARTKANLLVHFARTHCTALIPAWNKAEPTCVGCNNSFASATAYYYHAIRCLAPSVEINLKTTTPLIQQELTSTIA